MLRNGMNFAESQDTSHINIILGSSQGGVLLDKFVDYLIVTLLEMESGLTLLQKVFLKAANVNFFV